MGTLDFDAWFADYLRGKTEEGTRRLDEEEVARLLNEKIAVRFSNCVVTAGVPFI